MQRPFPPGLPLATALMMFPQVVETIYSPALPDIARGFSVTAEHAGQTLSLYFLAFALGVVTWGRSCDQWGRRPTMLAGLSLYGVASLVALLSPNFECLLIARMLAAFGAALGSVGTQTMLRDSYHGEKLARIFALMGVALAASPALGMISGAVLTDYSGYQGVFTCLAMLAAVLLGWSTIMLPETRPPRIASVSLTQTLMMMLKDQDIWRTALLVALFNVCLFAYYQLAPFDFKRMGLSNEMFGYSGMAMASGVGLGALLNHYLLKAGRSSSFLVLLAALLVLIGAMGVTIASTWRFIMPMVLVVMAYGIAIPNILATALANYADRKGTAGAVLGLLYYLMLGIGLMMTSEIQHLGEVLFCCGIGALLCAIHAHLAAPRTTTS
ncbi:multidrug effflux MFS transporter [Halomonas binhaiensis]|uniref:Bcr/CflA family efflux transporter n=1 Tax=Halomonas binhaiensis TaxID=2562282 RepID=A0A5C1NI50_9GAMM|nr:multidrug effflux MFS transporter [Halomonas binhaiensis]QEM82996.1 multidrug effflux MFS transporter [Halomonas binhaiensis]